jgi:D-xylose transport system ATP-binding protein
MENTAGEPILELKGICKRFGAVQALDEVDFEVYRGEVVGLVGDNGAGKSTLVKCISGINQIDSGEIFFEGKPVSISGPKDPARLGIETVYQDLALCDNLDVVGNLFLGREHKIGVIPSVLSALNEVTMEKSSVETLKTLSVKIPSVRSVVASLSGGQRQSIAVARAVMWNSKVVLLDEPTAALGVAQSKMVLDLIKNLRQKGLGVVVISHNLADVFEVADRIIVLRLGQRVGTFITRSTSREKIVAAITGAEFGVGKETSAEAGDELEGVSGEQHGG